MNYKNFNIMNYQEVDITSNDAINKVAAMINNSGKNRAQRRRLEKSMGRMETILSRTQKYVDRSAFKQYQAGLDENMRRFFSVLGIVVKEKYGFKESEDDNEISTLFDYVNQYLEKYQDLTTDEVSELCQEITDITLISQK